MSASIYFFNYVVFAKFHFSRSPRSLLDVIYFFKNAGDRSKCKIPILKKMRENEKKNMSANSCRIAENKNAN